MSPNRFGSVGRLNEVRGIYSQREKGNVSFTVYAWSSERLWLRVCYFLFVGPRSDYVFIRGGGLAKCVVRRFDSLVGGEHDVHGFASRRLARRRMITLLGTTLVTPSSGHDGY